MVNFQRGFTLVELITVMMVLGILSVGTVKFIRDSSVGFASTVSRSELASEGRILINRLSREIREALPNSVRVNASCIEFVPIIGASRYEDIPVSAAGTSFVSIPFAVTPVPAFARVAVYPESDVYQLSNPGTLSPQITVSAPDVNNQVTVTFASSHAFVQQSPTQRFFLVSSPVSYCLDNTRLYRYDNYGFLGAQATPATLPSNISQRSLAAENTSSSNPFSVSQASMTRNAIVGLDIEFRRDADVLLVNQSVQVRNVP